MILNLILTAHFMNSHYLALVPTYASVALLWFLIYKTIKKPWDKQERIHFQKPWLELIYAILSVVAILIIGQLYQRDLLLPARGNEFIDAMNQIIIFSPTVMLIALRKQSPRTIWLPKSNIPIRILMGTALAFISLLMYWIIREEPASLTSMFRNIYHPRNTAHLVQVFMEDITIALLFVRLAAWIGRKWSIALVSILFAAGHIPALVTTGLSINELSSLLLDAGIGVVIFSAVSKSQDVWWFFLVHFTLDMTQYHGG